MHNPLETQDMLDQLLKEVVEKMCDYAPKLYYTIVHLEQISSLKICQKAFKCDIWNAYLQHGTLPPYTLRVINIEIETSTTDLSELINWELQLHVQKELEPGPSPNTDTNTRTTTMFRKRKLFSRSNNNSSTPPISDSNKEEQAQVHTISARRTVQEERQEKTDDTVAILDDKISTWESKLAKERAEARELLAEMQEFKKDKREIPNGLRMMYTRKKKTASSTEAQLERLRCKRDDMIKAAEVAELTESLAGANFVQEAMGIDPDHVADVVGTAELQNEENMAAAEALAEHARVDSSLLDLEVEDELEQFLLEQGMQCDGEVESIQITAPTPVVAQSNAQQVQMKPRVESPTSIKPRTNTKSNSGRMALSA